MGLLGALFGGSKQKNESGNNAYSTLSPLLTPAVGTGVNALTNLSDILGKGFDDFKKNAGFDFAYNQGARGITGGAAATGLLNSGATQQALAKFQGDLGSQYYGNWLDRIGDVGKTGLAAGNLLASAGAYSKGKGSSNGGIIPGLFG